MQNIQRCRIEVSRPRLFTRFGWLSPFASTLLGSLALASTVLVGGCSSKPSEASCSGESCDAGADPIEGDSANTPDSGNATEAAPNCSATDLPDDDLVDSNCDGIDGDAAHAIFVSPDGSDDGAGTMSAPVATVAKGVELASAAGKDVYVCNATYAENVTVTGTSVGIYAGFDCADGWARSHSRARIAPANGVALTVKNVVDAMTVDGIDLQASDATVPGTSSVALFVVDSTALRVAHALIEAGDGAVGVPGGAVEAVTQPFYGAKRGTSLVNATCPLPDPGNSSAACYGTAAGAKAATTSTTCSTGGTVRGGGGGNGNNRYLTGTNGPGVVGSPGIPSAGTTSGTDGLVGSSGTPGSENSIGFGSVDSSGYLPSNSGSDGGNGKPGQSGTGGRGGNSSLLYAGDFANAWYVGGGGSEGGLAGCGGLGGKGGAGGGASIGALFVNSPVTLDWVEIRTGAGGAGGAPSDGANGQPGSPGAAGGNGTVAIGNGQDGGDGGNGGKGGPGGPGAGGPSVAIVATGLAPVLTAVTMTPGAGGLGGSAISGANGALGDSMEMKLIDVAGSDAGI